MVRPYTAAVRAHQPEGPYKIVGRCYGGYIAFELARQLVDQGQEVSLLAILDSGPPIPVQEVSEEMSNAPSFWGRILQSMHFLGRKIDVRGRIKREALLLFGTEQEQQALREADAYQEAKDSYVAKPLPGKITLIRSEGYQRLSRKKWHLTGWESLAQGGLDSYTVPGDHMTILKEPLIGDLGKTLQRCMD